MDRHDPSTNQHREPNGHRHQGTKILHSWGKNKLSSRTDLKKRWEFKISSLGELNKKKRYINQNSSYKKEKGKTNTKEYKNRKQQNKGLMPVQSITLNLLIFNNCRIKRLITMNVTKWSYSFKKTHFQSFIQAILNKSISNLSTTTTHTHSLRLVGSASITAVESWEPPIVTAAMDSVALMMAKIASNVWDWIS